MSLTLEEARARAAALADVSYELDLDLRDTTGGHYGSRTTVRFTASEPTTFLELLGAVELAVTLDGAPLDVDYDGARIPLHGLGSRHEVVVDARLPYVTDGDGMHLFTDPADGETYASAYLSVDVSQRVYACFDQVDLKGPVTVRVTADPAWTVLGNGRSEVVAPGVTHFATTPPIPTNQVVVCAGRWHSVRWEHRGLPFGWHARASLAAELDRDAEELARTTSACFDHYADLFDEPFAFDSYDQVFVQGQNWGAMETPGCVTYRDELLPRGRITALEAQQRAVVIAHEMAHMWFGNLVTMRWWEDTWLNESFADYMGTRVAVAGVGLTDAQVVHEVSRKPGAYDADRRRSTHPVAPLAEDVPDVSRAQSNFDAISYAKGHSVLRQLVTWLGDEAFLAGVNAHLTRHRFANATLADLVGALDAASDRDVRTWAEVWLRRSGFDLLRVEREPGGTPVLHRDGERPHRVRVDGYDAGWHRVRSQLVDVADDPVALDGWAGLAVLPNAGGETFAALALDDLTWAALQEGLSAVPDAVTRAVVWAAAFEQVQRRALDVPTYLDLVARHLPTEQDAGVVGAVLARTLGSVLPRRVPPADAGAVLDLVAAACRAGLAAAPSEEQAVALTSGLARTSRDVAALQGWLDADATPWGVALDPGLRWSVVRRLAELGAVGAGAITAERERDGTYGGVLGAATALAARPTAQAKDEAWAALRDPTVSNRMLEALATGLWSVEQAALLRPAVERYFREAAAVAAPRGPAFAQVLGRCAPALDVDQVALLDAALATDLPAGLRRAWEDRRDDL